MVGGVAPMMGSAVVVRALNLALRCAVLSVVHDVAVMSRFSVQLPAQTLRFALVPPVSAVVQRRAVAL
jgi:hypothetical protein